MPRPLPTKSCAATRVNPPIRRAFPAHPSDNTPQPEPGAMDGRFVLETHTALVAPVFAEFGQVWANSSPSWADSGQTRPKSGRNWPNWANFGQYCQARPNPTKIWTHLGSRGNFSTIRAQLLDNSGEKTSGNTWRPTFPKLPGTSTISAVTGLTRPPASLFWDGRNRSSSLGRHLGLP